jgi:chemotaxis protein MotB
MKRAIFAGVALAGLIAGFGQLGCCATQGQLDELRASNQACNDERTRLAGDLKAEQARADQLEKEKAFWLADKQNRMDDLVGQINRATAEIQTRDDEIRRLRAALDDASRQGKPEIVLQGPALEPEVDAALKKFVTDHPGLVEYDADKGLVRFSTDILFDSGSYTLKANMAKQIGDFAEVLNIPAARKYDALVVGHTDTVPVSRPGTREKTPTNWHLSVYRAVSVVEELVKAKVAKDRLGAMGFGDTRLRVNKQGAVPENRRVEIYLVPHGAVRTVGEAPAPAGPAGPPPAAVLSK